LCQEDEHWRLLVCDGRGSEPDLEAFLAAFGDRRIRYVAWDGVAGMAANWNRCLDSADTDLVTLLHADDELLKGYGGLMRKAAIGQPQAAAFFCLARIIDAKGDECFSFPDYVKRWLIPRGGGQVVLQGETSLRALLWGNFIMCPTLCYRKSRLGGRRFALRWRQVPDLEFTARLLLEGETLVGLPQTAYAYRRHQGNTTAQQTDSLLRFREEVALLEQLRLRLTEIGWKRAVFPAGAKPIIKLHLAYCVLRDLAGLRLSQAWRKLVFLQQVLRAGRPVSGSNPFAPGNALRGVPSGRSATERVS
jgi:hypothetical protein